MPIRRSTQTVRLFWLQSFATKYKFSDLRAHLKIVPSNTTCESLSLRRCARTSAFVTVAFGVVQFSFKTPKEGIMRFFLKGFSSLVVVTFASMAQANLLHIGQNSFDPTALSARSADLSTAVSNQYILQLRTPITEALKIEVESLGFTVLSYIPDNGLWIEGANPENLEQLSSYRAIVPFQAVWKLSENMSEVSLQSNGRVKLMVTKFVGQEVDYPMGTALLESSTRVDIVVMNRAQVPALINQPAAQYIELATQMETFFLPLKPDAARVMSEERVAYTGFESGTRLSNFGAAWERGFDGSGEKAAYADTGLDMGSVGSLHQDFPLVRKGYKFGLFARDWRDPQGHGTHVGGSIAGAGTASEGRMQGGAFAAELIPQGMWSPMLNNLSVPSELSDMFQPAYNDGARVHSNSWGSPRDLGAYSGMSAQVDQFMWDNPEFLLLFAAGNSGKDNDRDGRIDEGSVSSPGTAKNALTVGASENFILEGGIQRTLGELLDGEPWGVEPLKSDRLSDDEVGIAAFSSRGPTRDGRLKPEIVAPGTNIVSVCSRVEGATKLWGNYDENYCYAGGTSMSAPLTAGGATVVRQFLRQNMNLSSPSAAMVKGVLMHSAFNMFPGQYGNRGKSTGQEMLVDGPNMHQGFGRLDMMQATDRNAFYKLVDENSGVSTGETFTTRVQLSEAQPLRVTLVYTDAPAAANASRTLVNNLDLKVVLAGQELMSDSSINNFEQITLSGVTGEVVVEVSGTNVPMGKNGKQPFALIIGQ